MRFLRNSIECDGSAHRNLFQRLAAIGAVEGQLGADRDRLSLLAGQRGRPEDNAVKGVVLLRDGGGAEGEHLPADRSRAGFRRHPKRVVLEIEDGRYLQLIGRAVE